MKEQFLFESIPCDKYDILTRPEMISLIKGYEDLVKKVVRRNKELEANLLKGEQRSFLVNEQLINIKNKIFGKS